MDIYLRLTNKKLFIIVARFDGPLCDSAVLKHVIVIHYLQQPKKTHTGTERQIKITGEKTLHENLAAAATMQSTLSKVTTVRFTVAQLCEFIAPTVCRCCIDGVACKMGRFLQARLMPSCGVRVCVCLSRSYIMSKRTKISSKFFSPSGRQAIPVFPYQTAWQFSDRNLHNGGVECRCGRQKSGFSANIWLHCMLLTLRLPGAINTIVGRYLMAAGASAIN